MRTIKFRAWENGKMYYQVRCGGEFDGMPTAPTVWSEPHGDWINLTGQPYTKVMQFTGLHDKNGREIYEGDYFRNTETGSIFAVYYGSNSACYRAQRQDGWNFDLQELYPINNWEVVGNIYENPEITSE